MTQKKIVNSAVLTVSALLLNLLPTTVMAQSELDQILEAKVSEQTAQMRSKLTAQKIPVQNLQGLYALNENIHNRFIRLNVDSMLADENTDETQVESSMEMASAESTTTHLK